MQENRAREMQALRSLSSDEDKRVMGDNTINEQQNEVTGGQSGMPEKKVRIGYIFLSVVHDITPFKMIITDNKRLCN